jgi:hypothetical protein
MTLSEQQASFAYDVARLITHIFSKGYTCTLGEVFRTKEQAEIYVKQGKGTLRSLHCERLAIDINLFKDGRYLAATESHREFGEFWESLSPLNRWGGRFGDGNHYERRREG